MTAVVEEPQGRRYGRHRLVNSSDIVMYLYETYGVRLKPVTIRTWATRRKIKTYGSQRERYDLREVLEYAMDQKIIPRKRGMHGQED